ncbi:MAG: tRNA (guanosine(46)-N7)-methyltransferase TrmB [Actinobacteria bacterium]|nr:tRNA (guanosine(46)-N7)-methyltransferase TrmB [Actinomycetota bacterium]NCU89510.1 tRNA (guanosine(46)-N7)-methyltransferase TrmB [Actinomycetota bacterium]NDE53608.1 tRNA (guanosine(46)-N7)-methyltransferase TrmB [Actinomycetota bacterium]
MEQVQRPEFRLRSFRLRGDRMTKAQSEALVQHWNRFEVPLQGVLKPRELFPSMNPKEVVFEIGSGMGEATSQIAASNPETAYVAVEVHKPGLGALIIRAENLGVRNLKIINADIYEVLTKHLSDHSIDAFHIFFPDPWPKRKQHKRRLLQPNFIEILATKLKHGGRINIATDWYPYAQEIEKSFASNPDFTGGVIPRPDWRPLTKFESKGITKEHVVTDFEFQRR